MPNEQFREQHERDRARGLVARQETRQERAIRRQVAEEIAQAIEGMDISSGPERQVALGAAAIAREIGTREATE